MQSSDSARSTVDCGWLPSPGRSQQDRRFGAKIAAHGRDNLGRDQRVPIQVEEPLDNDGIADGLGGGWSTSVATLRRARFRNRHFRQRWQRRLQSIPYPAREVFARGILQARNVVQIPMIQRLERWAKCRLDVGEIHNPAKRRIHWALDGNFDPKTVAVQASTLVFGRYGGQSMGGFDLECFAEFHWDKKCERTADEFRIRLFGLSMPFPKGINSGVKNFSIVDISPTLAFRRGNPPCQRPRCRHQRSES